ncbi:MAG: manganese superoxide dismutase [Amphiamblys sp. WSBS2006]|nr:MAG: manganese superoxide dismutase [Amphiamblys sp. WSBS2006]
MFQHQPLPYPTSRLEPVIDEETVAIHHGKHQKGYTDKLNAALAPGGSSSSLAELLAQPSLPSSVLDNAGGVYNHVLYWNCMTDTASAASSKISTPLLDKINLSFGSFENMKQEFSDKAVRLLGSGWVWLGTTATGELRTVATQNQDNPMTPGKCSETVLPFLCIDVWEHAYYLKYRNMRQSHVAGWWSLVDWAAVSLNYSSVCERNGALPL